MNTALNTVQPRPLLALAAMLLVQMLATLALAAASVLAPAVAPLLGLPPERLGLFVATAYLAAMMAGLGCGRWAYRLGPVGLSQCGLLACMAGALAASLGLPVGLLVAALLIGAGYGVTNPAAASVLTHHAPLHARGLFFSIKQTGVPVGVAVAGLLLPLGLAMLGWRTTVVAVALGCGLAAAGLLALKLRLNPPRAAAPPAGGLMGPLRTVWREQALRRVSAASLVFALTQQSFLTFAVTWLFVELHWSLAAAAGLLSASQVVAAVARIAFGHVADRWVPPGRLLGGLGLAMSLFCLGLAALQPDSPGPWVVAAVLTCSATAVSWNGVYFAELARLVPAARMASISGATQVFTFAGGMLGPLLLGEFLRLGGGYRAGFALLAVCPAGMGLAMLLAYRRPVQPVQATA